MGGGLEEIELVLCWCLVLEVKGAYLVAGK
jgi:hypothetical protein